MCVQNGACASFILHLGSVSWVFVFYVCDSVGHVPWKKRTFDVVNLKASNSRVRKHTGHHYVYALIDQSLPKEQAFVVQGQLHTRIFLSPFFISSNFCVHLLC